MVVFNAIYGFSSYNAFCSMPSWDIWRVKGRALLQKLFCSQQVFHLKLIFLNPEISHFFQFQFDMLRGHRQRTQASNGAQKCKTGLFFCVSLFICCQSLFLVFSSELCHEGLSSNATNSSRGMLRHKVVMWDCNKHVWRRTSLQQQQGWHFE